MRIEEERWAMARVIHNSFVAMELGEWPDPSLQGDINSGDMQLAFDLQKAGFRLVTGKTWIDSGPLVTERHDLDMNYEA